MKNKIILSFIVSLFFVSLTNAQWWVQGGNLLWPYGTVTVKDSFSVGGNASISGGLTVDDDVVFSSTLGVDGYTNLGSTVDVQGDLNAYSSVHISGDLTYGGTLNSVKVYTALLSQSGTDDPVALLLENTLGPIDWSRTGTGRYTATFHDYTIDPEKLFINCVRYSDNSGTVRPITINATTTVITFRQDNQDLNDWGAAVIDLSSTKYYPVSFILYH
jgi:hypothetical protein